MRNVTTIAVRLIVCAICCWSVSALLWSTVRAQEFPVIIDSPSELRQIGIAVSFGTEVPPLRNKCYYYGDGGYLISTSDEFYGRFKQRGFSLEALCLGLISETHYDPESGHRLPTYILVDRALIKENMRQFGKVVEPGTVSDELPLDLPDCFKNANPYTDCRFQFGRVTGKALTAAQTDAYKRLGAAIDKVMGDKIRSIKGTEEFFGQGEDEEYIKGFRRTVLVSETDGAIPEDLQQYSSASIWVRSTRLLRGYGYGLDADGAAGPDVNPAALKAATEGLSKSQIDVPHLREILNSSNR
jgi:hypothetical protein